MSQSKCQNLNKDVPSSEVNRLPDMAEIIFWGAVMSTISSLAGVGAFGLPPPPLGLLVSTMLARVNSSSALGWLWWLLSRPPERCTLRLMVSG